MKCPKCSKDCELREDRNLWPCTGYVQVPKKKKRTYCGYSVSDFKGSFLCGTHIPPWKIVLFINHYLSHLWDHKTVIDCLGLSSRSSVDWRSFSSEVCLSWFQKQKAIGAAGVEVEIDETLITCRKYERGCILKQIWLFGGIERVSKRRFVVASTGEIEEKRDKATLVPLIQRYILPGSVIYSDCWGAYKGLDDLEGCNYTHFQINHSTNFVDSVNKNIHTQNIDRLWRCLKEWCKRPGIRTKYLEQYLARYLFITSTDRSAVLHKFFKVAASLYPPCSERNRTEPAGAENEAESSSDSDSEPSE